ncbi:MAG: 50S ribosomal protein L9 [Sulfurimonas sp. RIFOXYD2_FULL_37_8]|nr:MAG: 50S ribosomal protein L9 [Sulfurimonas sp. RIFOXYD2_FULL_37_8]
MKVLLIKDVKTLGKAGEVKEVKDGYGQNFLIAKGFAKHATTEILAQHKEEERIAAENLAKEIASLKELATKLDKTKIVIRKKLGQNGHLFGSITKDEVAHALLEQHNIEIDKKHITDKLSIKSVGEHKLDLRLGHAIHATLHVDVVGE